MPKASSNALGTTFCSAILALAPHWAMAQAPYPSKPVTVVVPLAAGGPVETEARLYAGKLSGLLGQPFIVDIKTGAGGLVAGTHVAKAAPDGYTLLAIYGGFTTFPALYRNPPFDLLKDFAPLSLGAKRGLLLMAPPSFAPRNYTEFVAYAKAKPGKINFGVLTDLPGLWLQSATHTKLTLVQYKGTGAVLPDLIAGRVDVTAMAISLALPHIKAGKLRPLFMLGDKRTHLFPDLQTADEMGATGFDYSAYTGLVAPAATPPAIVNRLSDSLIRIVRTPEVTARFKAEGSIILASTPAEFRQMLTKEVAVWRRVVQENGIKMRD